MQINQIIREKRKALGLTQEQVVERLGVSAPAVNKWEKGSTYPDITLLPALARLLQTDMNTLLAFSADLTDLEIENMVNDLDQVVQEQGYAKGFQAALDKLQEYPASERLLYGAALYLDGALLLYNVPEQAEYRERLQPFYERLAASTEADIRETAQAMLIVRYRNSGDFDKAWELLQGLPASTIDKEEQMAALYTQQGKYQESKKLWEHRILSSVTKIQTALLYLLEIALKEERMAEAAVYARKYAAVSRELELPEWMALNAHLQLTIGQRDSQTCMAILRKMLPAMREKWEPKACPLYSELSSGESSGFFLKLADALKVEIMNSEELDFIRTDEAFAALKAELAAL